MLCFLLNSLNRGFFVVNYVFCLTLCVLFFGSNAMDLTEQQKEQKIREKNFLLWRLYKPEVKEITCSQPLVTPLNGFTKTCSFFCHYKSGSNHKVCIVKDEAMVSNTPSYSFNIFKCKWDKVYLSCESTESYFCDVSTGKVKEVDFSMAMLWTPDFIDISSEAYLIRSFCAKFARQKKIFSVYRRRFSLNQDLSSIVCITDQGVLYLFSPGKAVNCDIPHKLYDAYFRFTEN